MVHCRTRQLFGHTIISNYNLEHPTFSNISLGSSINRYHKLGAPIIEFCSARKNWPFWIINKPWTDHRQSADRLNFAWSGPRGLKTPPSAVGPDKKCDGRVISEHRQQFMFQLLPCWGTTIHSFQPQIPNLSFSFKQT